MTDHVHVYEMHGRCIRSAPMREMRGPDDQAAADGVPAGLRRALLDMGFLLRDWSRTENAGLVSTKEQSYIVRVKPAGLMRDMRSTKDTLEAIRESGVPIDGLEAWIGDYIQTPSTEDAA